MAEFGGMTTSQVVGMGWTSPPITDTSAEGMWAALDHCARNAEDFKDVKNVVCRQGAGFLVRTMTINATGKVVEEHIRTDKSKGEMTFRLMDIFTKQEVGEERVISMQMQPLRLEFYCRNVSTGVRVHWAAPVAALQAMIPKLAQYGAMTMAEFGGMTSAQVVGMGWTSPPINETNAEGMWAALDHCARNAEDFKDVRNVVCTQGAGFLVRTMTINATGKVVEEHIRTDKSKDEMTFRLMDIFTKQELGEERVIAMKMQPLRLEFFCRSVNTGVRLHWAAPVAAVQAMIPKLAQYGAGKGSDLSGFLIKDGKVDPCVASYVTKELQAESIADFANLWTQADFEQGMQDDVVSQVKELSGNKAASRLQVARLRAAWSLAQKQVSMV